MTSAPQTTPLSFETLGDAVAALRSCGLRLSSTRRLILEALFAAAGPASADDLAGTARLDPASVYRNLETLERHGLVKHVHFGHGPGLYALVGGGEREYLYCERCGAVAALRPERLDPIREQLRELAGYRARFTHFAIVGVCRRCAEEDLPSLQSEP
jgi:Fur family transcriptional regulator, ferric uptake regulator